MVIGGLADGVSEGAGFGSEIVLEKAVLPLGEQGSIMVGTRAVYGVFRSPVGKAGYSQPL